MTEQGTTRTGPTSMDEFLLDMEDLEIPGTSAGPEPRPRDADYEAKFAAWEAAGAFGQLRRGFMAEDVGDYGDANTDADHPAPGFTLIDSRGRVVMRGQYARARMGPAVYRALRNLLDAIDPPRAYAGDGRPRRNEPNAAEMREIRPRRRQRRRPPHGTGAHRRKVAT